MKESYYFPHDHNARNDERVLKIRSQFNNAEGYGIYFMIIEVLAESSDGSIDASDMAPLSLSLSLPKATLEDFMNLSISLGLFKKKGDRIYSDRMNEYKKFREERSESGRKGAKTRWELNNSSAIAKPMAPAMLIKGKERKGNNRLFVKPTPSEITAYARSIGYELDGQYFFDSYEKGGWVYGKARIPVKNWKACVRIWKSNNFKKGNEEGSWVDGAEKAAQRDREAIKKKMELLKRGSMELVNPSTQGGIQAGDGSVKKA